MLVQRWSSVVDGGPTLTNIGSTYYVPRNANEADSKLAVPVEHT